jgi:hypothetical protein
LGASSSSGTSTPPAPAHPVDPRAAHAVLQRYRPDERAGGLSPVVDPESSPALGRDQLPVGQLTHAAPLHCEFTVPRLPAESTSQTESPAGGSDTPLLGPGRSPPGGPPNGVLHPPNLPLRIVYRGRPLGYPSPSCPVQSTSVPVSRLYSVRSSRRSTHRSERSFT